jgi:hypothetical protein
MTKKKTQHTPGPWSAATMKGGRPLVRPKVSDFDTQPIATVEGGYSQSQVVLNANARLIAAAPDLLDALRELRERCGSAVRDAGKFLAALDRADAAIAKATGEGP